MAIRTLLFTLLVCLIVHISPIHADLIDRGNGMIYDTDLGITWLQDANYAQTSGCEYCDEYGRMSWNQANDWAEALDYGGYSDWRLPKTLPVDGVNYNTNLTYDGSTDIGWNISAPGSAYPGSTANELAYMYYNNLNNKGSYDTNGISQAEYGLRNTGPFILQLSGSDYWSGSDVSPDPDSILHDAAWNFHFDDGFQSNQWKFVPNMGKAWAVRDGDVAPVPIPGAIWIFGSGLLGLLGIKKRMK